MSLKMIGVVLIGFIFFTLANSFPLARNPFMSSDIMGGDISNDADNPCPCSADSEEIPEEMSNVRRRVRQLSVYNHPRNHRCIKLLGSEHLVRASNGEQPLTVENVASRLESMVRDLSQGLADITGAVLPPSAKTSLPVTPIGLGGAVAEDAKAAEGAAEDPAGSVGADNSDEDDEPEGNEVAGKSEKAPS